MKEAGYWLSGRKTLLWIMSSSQAGETTRMSRRLGRAEGPSCLEAT